MQLNAAQLAEHDEELAPVTSTKGDVAHFKVNHHSKQVWIKTGENDGNEKQWRLTGGSYDSIMALSGRNAQGQVIGDPLASAPIEPTDPFGRPVAPATDDE